MEPTATRWMETRPQANLSGYSLDVILGHVTSL
ncbi:MAG: hypothetical protein QOE90_1291 [Thermoplasmata archaeon]|jgi:hypothetical protein|nr:hypothetical protein [Thermoplasmata archaeon]